MSARHHDQGRPGRRQEGVAAVEMALLSFVMAMILLSPIMIARFLMQTTLTQRAAYNAVHMLATYPRYDRLNAASSPVADATAMVTEALNGGGVSSYNIGTANCASSANCTSKFAPTTISIIVDADVLDPTSVLPNLGTVTITTSAYDRYAN